MPRGVYPRKPRTKSKKQKKAAAQPTLVVGRHVPIKDGLALNVDFSDLDQAATDAGGHTTDRRLRNAYLRHQEATQHLIAIAGISSSQVNDITAAGREMVRTREVLMAVLSEWVAERHDL